MSNNLAIEKILEMEAAAAACELTSLGFTDGSAALREFLNLAKGPFIYVLETVAKCALSSASPDTSLTNLERIIQDVNEDILTKFINDIDDNNNNQKNLKELLTLCGASSYLSAMLTKTPEWFEWLFIDGNIETQKGSQEFAAELASWTAAADTVEVMGKKLRQYRNREYIRIGARDLNALACMEEVTAELSDLAGATLNAAIGFAISELTEKHGAPVHINEEGDMEEAEFAVIGLGKLGGRELNFLSDIDILYVYSTEKGETNGQAASNYGTDNDTGSDVDKNGKMGNIIALHEFFVKLSKQTTRLISRVTEDGFVFRVDLDLRPEGRSGGIVNSLRSMEVYYESWGQAWEKNAMIKARCVAGSERLGREFTKMIRPFSYRKYLDFGAIADIKGMKEKIDIATRRKSPDVVDVKLGRGGIREIEFFCQALQLIYGGKVAELRESNTLKAIKKLSNKKLISVEDANSLTTGYIFLRNLEHRIQVIEGRHTQAIPRGDRELEKIARMMGIFSLSQSGKEITAASQLLKKYEKITDRVHEVYRTLFYNSEEELSENALEEAAWVASASTSVGTPEPEALDALSRFGFSHPDKALKHIALVRDGQSFVRLTPTARSLRRRLTPFIISKAAGSPNPDLALQNIERFVTAVGAKTGPLSLLAENPPLIEELITIFGSSEFLSTSLVERPEGLDLVLSAEMTTPVKENFYAEINGQLRCVEDPDDFEEKLDVLRRYKNPEVLRIALNDITGRLSTKEVGEQLTGLARAALSAAYHLSYEEVGKRHGAPSDKRFFILGMGKLAGGELLYGSDLDIVFVYAGQGNNGNNGNGETSGPKVITDHEFFVKLAQKIIGILTLRTREGVMFEVDTRLRPSGSSGPLVVTKDSLLGYHKEKAAIWETQAALKSQVVAGDMDYGRETFEQLEQVIYSSEKPLTTNDINELLRIRKRMEREIAKEGGGNYNIKTGRGAVVDIEFLVQTVQLKYGAKEPALRTPNTLTAIGEIKKLLDTKEVAGLTVSECEFLEQAYEFYRKIEKSLRVVYASSISKITANTGEINVLAKKIGYNENLTEDRVVEKPGDRLLADYLEKTEKTRELYKKVMHELKQD